MRLTVVKAVTPVTALRVPRTEKRCRATAPPTQNLVVDGFWWNEGLVSPQDTYEAGPNVNEVLPPNPGTNILTTTRIQFLYIAIHNAVQYILKYTHVKIRTRMKPPGSVPIDKGTKTNKNETEETCIMLFEREVPTENPKLRSWSDSQAWEILATGFYAETDGNSLAEVWGERGAGLLNEDIPGKNQYASHLSYWLHCSQAFPIKPFWNVLSLELDARKRSTSQRTT